MLKTLRLIRWRPGCAHSAFLRQSSSTPSPNSLQVCNGLLDLYKVDRKSATPKFRYSKSAPPVKEQDFFQFQGQKLPPVDELPDVKGRLAKQLKVLGSLYISYIISDHIVRNRGYLVYQDIKAQRAKFAEKWAIKYLKTDLPLFAGQLLTKSRPEADEFFRSFLKMPEVPYSSYSYLNHLAPYIEAIDYEAVWSKNFTRGFMPDYPSDAPYHILCLASSSNVKKLKPYFYQQAIDTRLAERAVKAIERHGRLVLELNMYTEAHARGIELKLHQALNNKVAKLLLQASMLKHVSKSVEWQEFVEQKPWDIICTHLGLMSMNGVDLSKMSSNLLDLLTSKKALSIQDFMVQPAENKLPETQSFNWEELAPIVDRCGSEEFQSEVYKLGSKVLETVPYYHNLLTDAFRSNDLNEELKSAIKEILVADETTKALQENNPEFSPEVVAGIYFMADPYRCLQILHSRLQNEPCSNIYDSLKNYMITKDFPTIDVSSNFLKFESSTLGLPSVTDGSVTTRVLLLNSSLVDAKSAPNFLKDKPLGNTLKSASRFGESWYKLLVKREVLQMDDPELGSKIYSLLTNDQYFRFLLEKVNFFGDYIRDKRILQGLFEKRSNRDLASSQVGQYFTVLYLNDQNVCQSWVNTACKTYQQVFSNLSITEVNESYTYINKTIGKQETFFDQLNRTNIHRNFSKAVNKLLFGFKAPNPIESYDKDLMVQQAKMLLSYYFYVNFFTNDLFTFIARHDSSMKEIVNQDPDEEYLKMIGIFASHQNIENLDETVGNFVRELMGSDYRMFDFKQLPRLPRHDIKRTDTFLPPLSKSIDQLDFETKFWRMAKLPQTSSKEELDSILAVNSTVSLSFFRTLNYDYKTSTRLSEAIKKLAIVGQTYYKFLLRYYTNKQEGLTSDQKVSIVKLMSKKSFKAKCVRDSGILVRSVRDSRYWGLISKQLTNQFLMLKVGTIAFDQNIARMLFIEPLILQNWIHQLVDTLAGEFLPDSAEVHEVDSIANGPTFATQVLERGIEEFLSEEEENSKFGK